ncbi:hybrid sensor histidine kinase/response regulator [Pseudomonas putida]|uniref:histidine kinase n=1 Tax=Pseudomonas putida TaxID=303 RepID=A0A2S3X4B9_PSEPU|nr:hybrid sensor histidine kinase/response regulator [Pseudomonas putida]POG16467.1 hybrid sensor histidine kinase/response regulator [Pseudomonas putida]
MELATRSSTAEGMAEQVTRFDWRNSALGPLPHWQAPLRIAVDMMVLSPFPCAVVWGAQMTVIHNDAYAKLLECEGHALGQAFDRLWAKSWKDIGPWVFKVLEGGSNFVEDQPLRLTNKQTGAQARYAFSYTPLRDAQHEVVGFLHTANASVDAHEEWREQALAFEREIERIMADRDHIWQLSRDAMIVVTRDLRLQAANPTWFRILGWAEDEVSGKPILELVHPADRAEVEVAVMEYVSDGRREQLETRLRHKDGHYRLFRWTASFDGTLLTAVGRDISQDHEDALQQSTSHLWATQRLESVSHLAGGMAHEMNNLLSGIGGSLELLQRRMDQGRLEQIERYVALATDSVQRAMTLTHRLLAFSRHQPLSPKPLDINRQLTSMEPLLRQVLGAEMRVDWELDVEPWTISLDVAQLENALVNLFANAREACLERGVVTLRTINKRLEAPFPDERGLAPGDYVAVYVTDDGHGMPEGDMARAFEPFFTTKPKGHGAGLGLAMVYGFVGQSGGYVWLESVPDHGLKVCMLFPRCLEHIAQEAPQPVPAVTRARGQRVLLVDDEENLRLVMKEYLQERGFDVCDARDANSALERFRYHGPFDLVITDIGLPGGFSGRQVARAMRMFEPDQKILFITGFNDQPLDPQLSETPGTALMLKPFALASLMNQALLMLSD